MEIQVLANIGVCAEFMKDEAAEKAEVSVVISPIKLVQSDDTGKIQIITGCNLWRSCHNPDCYYSLTARENKKTQAGK